MNDSVAISFQGELPKSFITFLTPERIFRDYQTAKIINARYLLKLQHVVYLITLSYDFRI